MILKESENDSNMARSVKKGPYIDKGITKAVEKARAGGQRPRSSRPGRAARRSRLTWSGSRSACTTANVTSDLRDGKHGGPQARRVRRRARSRATRERRLRRQVRSREHRPSKGLRDGSNSECEVFARFGAKARLVVDMIRGKDVNQALAILRFTKKRAAHISRSACVRRLPTPTRSPRRQTSRSIPTISGCARRLSIVDQRRIVVVCVRRRRVAPIASSDISVT